MVFRVAAALVFAAGVARADTPERVAELPATTPTEPPAPDTPADAPVTPPPVPRTREQTLRAIFSRRYASSRLFAMPVADTVGPYMLTLSGDGSLLQQPGLLTSAGVVAIGFGDIAQLEYRHTEAIGVGNVYGPVPSIGVQVKAPIPDRLNVPAFGVAFRLGVPRSEQFEGAAVTETVTDLYAVGRLRMSFAPWLTLHGGVRASQAQIDIDGATTKRRLYLPTGGYEIEMNATSRIVGEIALAPQFSATPPQIGYGVLGRFGLRWQVIPSITFDASIGYQLDAVDSAAGGGIRDVVQQWDIRLGAEVFVPWGALACRAAGVFCE